MLSDLQIVDLCETAKEDQILSQLQYSNRVVRISDDLAVKFGHGVLKEEADNQTYFHGLTDPLICKIPKVHRFFTFNDKGYIVMDYFHGHVKAQLDNKEIERVADALNHLATFRGQSPGNLTGGPLRGILFEFGESFTCTKDLENKINAKLFPHQPSFQTQDCDLVLCHLDVAPRNIMWLHDGSLGIIDWASAGYTPRYFEHCSQWILNDRESQFYMVLQEHLPKLSENEKQQSESFMHFWHNCQVYTFGQKSDIPKISLDTLGKNSQLITDQGVFDLSLLAFI